MWSSPWLPQPLGPQRGCGASAAVGIDRATTRVDASAAAMTTTMTTRTMTTIQANERQRCLCRRHLLLPSPTCRRLDPRAAGGRTSKSPLTARGSRRPRPWRRRRCPAKTPRRVSAASAPALAGLSAPPFDRRDRRWSPRTSSSSERHRRLQNSREAKYRRSPGLVCRSPEDDHQFIARRIFPETSGMVCAPVWFGCASSPLPLPPPQVPLTSEYGHH